MTWPIVVSVEMNSISLVSDIFSQTKPEGIINIATNSKTLIVF